MKAARHRPHSDKALFLLLEGGPALGPKTTVQGAQDSAEKRKEIISRLQKGVWIGGSSDHNLNEGKKKHRHGIISQTLPAEQSPPPPLFLIIQTSLGYLCQVFRAPVGSAKRASGFTSTTNL